MFLCKEIDWNAAHMNKTVENTTAGCFGHTNKKKPINLRNINPTSEKRDHATADSAMYEILDLIQTGYIHEYKRST